MKKIGPKIILATFLIIICFSWLLWIFLEKFVDTTNYENRERIAQPRLTLDGYATYSDDYESWFNDNIPFRNNLITLNTAIDFFIFNKSTNNRVIKGSDDWLFYADASDGDPIGCYQGTNLLSEEELQNIAQNCMNQRDFLEEQGKEFVIFIAPNKERVYSEYMPDRYGEPAENYRVLQVYDYLKENTDIRIVYPYAEIMRAKAVGSNIYYKTDTHWNEIGGYVGAAALLEELGIDMPDVLSDDVTISKVNNTAGDLANMLNLTKQLQNTDYVYSVEGYDNHQMECLEWDFYTVFSYQATNVDSRKIYVIRDSFSTAMSSYIGSQFSESYFRHVDTYSYDDLTTQDPDVVVYERVERKVDALGSFTIQ